MKIYYAFNHADICDVNSLQFDLNALEIWAAKWQLTISIQKSFIPHISFKNPSMKYYICGSEIASRDIICDLGMHVSNDLSFNDHIYINCKKAYWVINNIFRSFCCKDTDVYVKAYSSYVRPHLEYVSYIWSLYKGGIIKYITKVRKYFTRLLLLDVILWIHLI